MVYFGLEWPNSKENDCHRNKVVKAGFVRGKQRYKCKNCGIHFTESTKYLSTGKGKHKYEYKFKRLVCLDYIEAKKRGTSVRQFVKEFNEQDHYFTNPQNKMITHSIVLYWLKKFEVCKKSGEEF